MSALGQKQISEHARVMSALPPKADIRVRRSDVRFVPKADILRRGKSHAIRSPRWREAEKTLRFSARAPWRS
jgi:hypothetical protein